MDQKPEIIVKEIPVLVSKSMSEKLHLLQYPLRPAEESLKDCNILQTRIKPGQNKMQLKWELETSSRNYDKSRGESLVARNLDSNDEGDSSKKLDCVMLESSPTCPGSKPPRYVIGVLKGGQLHISPLKNIMQLKPHLSYYDKASQDAASEQGNDTEDDAEEEATKVTVKFTRGSRDPNAKGKNSKTYFSVRKQEEEEPWVDLQYQHSSTNELHELYSKNPDNESPFYVLNPQNYMSLLIPKYKPTPYPSAAVDKNKGQTARVSIAQLQSMTLPEQLKILMLNGKVLQYGQVVDFLKLKLKADVDDVTLLRTIQNVAILVQGCWVVKSDLVYEADFISSSNGIPAALMQNARDLVLSQFTESRIVERKKIGALTRLPHDEVTEILNQVSQMVPRKGWEFILPYDSEFINKYPEVVQRQQLIWKMKNQQKTRRLSEREPTSNNTNSSGPLKPPMGSPPRRRSRNKSHSSDTDSGAESDHRRGGRQRRNSGRSDLGGIPSKVEM